MDKHTNQKINIALLGHGDFAQSIFAIISKHFNIVSQAKADCLVVCNYGKILTQIELSKPKFGAINIHPSLLPKYRGPSPIQSAIAQGEIKTGITIIKLDWQVDHGPILAQAKVNIEPDETAEELTHKLAKLSQHLIIDMLKKYFSDELTLLPQDDSLATYTIKNKKPFYICPNDNPLQQYNLIRAYANEPGVFIQFESLDLKILKAQLIDKKLVPTLVQRRGKKPMTFEAFKHGYKDNLPILI